MAKQKSSDTLKSQRKRILVKCYEVRFQARVFKVAEQSHVIRYYEREFLRGSRDMLTSSQ